MLHCRRARPGRCCRAGYAQAPKPDAATLAKTGILERLAERSGIYGVPPTAKYSLYRRRGWPQKLPNNWMIGEVGGLYVAPDDHIWVLQRPRSLARRGGARASRTEGGVNEPVRRVRVPASLRILGTVACPRRLCWSSIRKAGYCDPGEARPIREMPRRMRGASGLRAEHGIFLIITGSCTSAAMAAEGKPSGSAWEATHGADGLILKFTKDGKFVIKSHRRADQRPRQQRQGRWQERYPALLPPRRPDD